MAPSSGSYKEQKLLPINLFLYEHRVTALYPCNSSKLRIKLCSPVLAEIFEMKISTQRPFSYYIKILVLILTGIWNDPLFSVLDFLPLSSGGHLF